VDNGETAGKVAGARPHRTRPPYSAIDLGDEGAITQWCDYFGITREQLAEAVNAAGHDSNAVAEHLLNQGASSGAG